MKLKLIVKDKSTAYLIIDEDKADVMQDFIQELKEHLPGAVNVFDKSPKITGAIIPLNSLSVGINPAALLNFLNQPAFKILLNKYKVDDIFIAHAKQELVANEVKADAKVVVSNYKRDDNKQEALRNYARAILASASPVAPKGSADEKNSSIPQHILPVISSVNKDDQGDSKSGAVEIPAAPSKALESKRDIFKEAIIFCLKHNGLFNGYFEDCSLADAEKIIKDRKCLPGEYLCRQSQFRGIKGYFVLSYVAEASRFEYDLALMSSLPGNSEAQAESGKIYLSSDGTYLVRDYQGKIQKGSLEAKIYLNNLSNRLNDRSLKMKILEVTSRAGHTVQFNHDLLSVPLIPGIMEGRMSSRSKYQGRSDRNKSGDRIEYKIINNPAAKLIDTKIDVEDPFPAPPGGMVLDSPITDALRYLKAEFWEPEIKRLATKVIVDPRYLVTENFQKTFMMAFTLRLLCAVKDDPDNITHKEKFMLAMMSIYFNTGTEKREKELGALLQKVLKSTPAKIIADPYLPCEILIILCANNRLNLNNMKILFNDILGLTPGTRAVLPDLNPQESEWLVKQVLGKITTASEFADLQVSQFLCEIILHLLRLPDEIKNSSRNYDGRVRDHVLETIERISESISKTNDVFLLDNMLRYFQCEKNNTLSTVESLHQAAISYNKKVNGKSLGIPSNSVLLPSVFNRCLPVKEDAKEAVPIYSHPIASLNQNDRGDVKQNNSNLVSQVAPAMLHALPKNNS